MSAIDSNPEPKCYMCSHPTKPPRIFLALKDTPEKVYFCSNYCFQHFNTFWDKEDHKHKDNLRIYTIKKAQYNATKKWLDADVFVED